MVLRFVRLSSGRTAFAAGVLAGNVSHNARSASQVTESATKNEAIIVPAKSTTLITIGVSLSPH